MGIGITELSDGCKLSRTFNRVTCTRSFVYNANGILDVVDVPSLGDSLQGKYPLETNDPLWASYDTDFSHTLCKAITLKPLEGDARNTIIECTYNNDPVDVNVFTDSQTVPVLADLPRKMAYSGEFIVSKPIGENIGKWIWNSDGTAVEQNIFVRVRKIDLSITRYVVDYFNGTNNYWSIFKSNVNNLMGCINNSASFPDVGVAGNNQGCWLFNGASVDQFRDSRDRKVWRAELIFTFRCPDKSLTFGALGSLGWLQIWRNNATWDIPCVKTAPQEQLYMSGNLSALVKNTAVAAPAFLTLP